MVPAAAAAAAATAPAILTGGSFAAISGARRKYGELLGKLRRAAVWALGSGPIAGTNENLAVPATFFALKFVDRHE